MKHLRKIGIILLFIISAIRTQSQVQAEFSASPLSGCAPLVVRFQDQSTGPITSRTWDLGNGTVSTVTNPTTTYFNPGVYPVKLIVRSASGADSIIKTNYITVFAMPEAKFEADDSVGCYPLTVNFSDQSTTAAGSITSWSWDFGDGTISSERNPSHTYTFSGDFTVTLRIVSSNGCINSIAKQRHIKVADGVNADFFAPIASACKPPVNIPFTNLSTGPGTLTYSWDFGNSQTSTQRNPTARFDNAGDFTVTLIATSSSGCTDTIQKPVSIPASTITSSFTSVDTACIRQQVSFTNTSLPDPDSTFWSFGDGSTSQAFSPNKTYNTPGVYSVRLRNKFGTCIDTFVKTIVIVDTPKAAFTNSIAVACKPPFSVKFIDQSTGAVSWLWEFSDGTTSTARHPDKIFNSFGTLSVKLTVTNRSGCKSSITKTGLVQIARPTFTIRNLPDSGCVPFTVSPIIDVNAVDTVASYFWDFGNGTTSTNPRPSVTYNASGNYTIKLVIRTKGGCTDSISVPGIKAGVGNVVVANFVADPLSVCAGQSIQFTDQSTGDPTGWLWEFGDGSTSSEQNPIHSYTDTGFFDVKLIAYNTGCPSELEREKYVKITGAIARYGYQINCENRNQMTFLDSSINAATWFWDFKDGTTSTEKSPTHTFPGVGHYQVSLTVTRDGCSHTYSRDIYIVDETAQYTISPNVLCRGSDVTFNAIVKDEYAIGQYEWDFGNGVYVIGPRSPVFNYSGFANGTYTTRLRIIDYNGCFDSTSQVIKIGGPHARFGMDVTSGCKGLTINFTDSSYADVDNAIVTRIWDFGDGTIQTINSGPVQHTYLNPGNYTVKLKVIDAVGCADSLVLRNQIIITEPKASFYATDTITCPSRPIQFINTSTATVNNFTWTFGDGTGSTLKNPAHIYTTVGEFTVKLKIRDRFGCEDSMTRVNYIIVDTPYAAFTVSDSVGTCPPLEVKFTFAGKHNQTIKWDFGDGGASNLLNPTHFYSIPGVYQARLIVTSPGGCRDTAYKTITVYGPNGTLSYNPLGGCNPLTVNFNVTTQNVDSILWDFADGNTLFSKDSILTYTYTDSGLFTPRVILQDALGCRVPIQGADPIKVTRTFPDFDSDTKLLCDRGIVQFYDSTFSNGTITGWLWNFGDGGTSTQQNPLHTYTSPGTYNVTLIVTTEFGCTDTITKPALISVVNSPVTAITASQDSVCVNGSITFQGVLVQPDTSALTWSWNFANGQGSTLQNPPAQQYNQSGNFIVQLITTNSSGCKDTSDYPVYIQPLPITDAGPDSTICLGQSIQLNATGATTYQWTPAATLSCTTCATPVATPSVNTMYYLTGQTAFGCTTTDSVLISVIQPSVVSAPADDSLCAGQSIELIASGTDIYTWSPATGLSNPTIANPVASPATTTTYVVTGSDIKGCFVTTDTVTISVFPYPTVEAGRDTTIPVGFFTPLNAQISPDVTNIQWTPTVGLSCSTCPNPVASPTFNTSYTITVTNSGGCSSSDVVTIRVVCNNANVFMPNTFSPNGDGMNDIYYPRGRGINTIRSLRIFNRWGQMVYERKNFNANDASAGWDGTFKGARLSPDVYVYILDLSCENNSIITMKGDITLIR